MFNFFANFFTKTEEQLINSQECTNHFGNECQNSFNISTYLNIKTIEGAAAKYNDVKRYLLKTFLENNSLEKYEVNSYNPVGFELSQLKNSEKHSEIKNDLEAHDMGLLDGTFGYFFFHVESQKSGSDLMTLSNKLYLNSLRNKILTLVNTKNSILTSEEKENLTIRSQVILDLLEKDTRKLNKKIHRPNQMGKKIPTKFDTNKKEFFKG